ncbi:MAG: phosphoglycolate phosphatase [Candidatus Bathyarchaeia archaeon]
MKIKAVATDVDGTLTDKEERISCKAIEAIRNLEAKGISVILASGNALCVLKTLKNYLGCSGALICENGAVVEYEGRIKVFGKLDNARSVLKRLKEKYGDKIVESWSNPYRLVDLALRRTIEKEKIIEVMSDFPNLNLLDSGYAYHILNKEVNKGKALEAVAELMGIGLNEIVAIGDSETDVEMFKAVSYGIAVANSPKSLKAVAKHVTAKGDGEGFFEASELILSKWLKSSY